MQRRNLLSSLGLGAIFLVASASASAAPLDLGKAIPQSNLELTTPDGGKTSIGKNKGKVGTLVVFTCNHCPYVKAWEDRIAKLGNTFQSKGIGVIAVNSNSPKAYPEDGVAEMKARAKKLELNFPYAVDEGSKLARAFGATKTPEVFLFNAKGELVYYGAVDDNYRDASKVKEKFLENALNALVNKTKITKASSKALGCGIKFYES